MDPVELKFMLTVFDFDFSIPHMCIKYQKFIKDLKTSYGFEAVSIQKSKVKIANFLSEFAVYVIF